MANDALIEAADHERMDTTRTPDGGPLDIARALLLVQGAILAAATIEAAIFGLAFGNGGGAVLMSGAAALAVLLARARLGSDRPWTYRVVYVVEGLTLASLAIDTVIASLIAGAIPPPVAVLTRLVIPAAVVALLQHSGRADRRTAPRAAAAGGS